VITIVEPKEHIDKLWGKQQIKDAETYRMMRYVLRVDHDGKVLLHNVVTGRLVVLDQGEAEALEKLPMTYSPVMEQLVTEHYLVPENYDEHQQVVNLRNILWRITDAQRPKEVTSYLILPTTACNARCWYCFEKGLEPATMTKETANDVVEFIEKHCGGKKIRLWWFGGEPTLAANRIDQICGGLKQRHIEYFSEITTNGYLFDDDMIARAKSLWNLSSACFSLDGTEENYNRVKAFQNVADNPYQRMMQNAGKLLKSGIAVALRMNYDQETYLDFAKLLKEVKERFSDEASLMVYPHQINREYPEKEREAVERWLNDTNVLLNGLARESGLYHQKREDLPSLSFRMCGAANGRWFVITPQGCLVSCSEQLQDDQIKGNIYQGINNKTVEERWRQFADYERCRECALFPICSRVVNCRAKDRCSSRKELMNLLELEIHELFEESVE